MPSGLCKILMRRDDLTQEEAEDIINEMKANVLAGADPEGVLLDTVQLEPDYIFDIM